MQNLTNVQTAQDLPSEWLFVDELRQQRQLRLGVDLKRQPVGDELDLRSGISYCGGFPDEQGLLLTAEADLHRLLDENDLAQPAGLPIRISQAEGFEQEAYELVIARDEIHLKASDREGARRGIYYLLDLLAGMDGPMLRVGVTRRRPAIRNRISRCFFGPIKRPPHNRDELANNVDYYPPAYLSRLAAEGINGLWLTISFAELCRTSITQPPAHASARLEKLRATVAQCARYGIRIWAFCIEPEGFNAENPLLKLHPQLGGATAGERICFCPSSKLAKQYLYECTQDLFTQVPGLGGLINISHGERPTTCLSSVESRTDKPVDCPRCSQLPKWHILHDSLAAMHAGMTAAQPDAKLISWMYMPTIGPCAQWVFDCASHTPPGVILQCNFESNIQIDQVGKPRVGGDYWLSVVGPSDDFTRIAQLAADAGTPMSAKLQVACSHEVATVPMVPVPGNLYRKFKAMRGLNIEHAMFCWYFGNYPGLMNRAANVASFSQETDNGQVDGHMVDEQTFLLQLAKRDWGAHASTLARAWKTMADAYSHYPLTNLFQYYGPMHTGPIWPLHLEPVMQPLARTWKPEDEPHGDVIGECLGGFTLDDAVILCDQLADGWRTGSNQLIPLLDHVQDQPDRLRDIRIALALAIQFDSGRNILRFYQLRQAYWWAAKQDSQPEKLHAMRRIVEREIQNSLQLMKLCEQEPSLGFHSESESYQYDIPRLHKRVTQLRQLLEKSLSEQSMALSRKSSPTPVNAIITYHCNSGWVDMPRLRWRGEYADNALHFQFICDATDLHTSVIYLWLLDEMGVTSPQRIRCERQDPFPNEHAPLISITQLEVGEKDIWQAHVRVPVTDDQICRGLSPAWISVMHNHRRATGQSGHTLWPSTRQEVLSRLRLLRFDPHNAARLILPT